jgi:CHAT domain-containing protein/tetratricopeptide (TPR) repeat protein
MAPRPFGLSALAVVLAAALPVFAQDSPLRTLEQAERLYRADRLPEAERLYLQALDGLSLTQQQRCYDRLFAIYIRVGRPDRAVRLGRSLERRLRSVGDKYAMRELTADMGGWYLTLGHYAEAETLLQEALKVAPGERPLPPTRRQAAWMHLARSAQKQGRRAEAGRRWKEVEREALAALNDTHPPLAPRDRIACVWKLAESYGFQEKHGKAVEQLNALLPVLEKVKDPLGKRDTLLMLAGHHSADKDFRAAERCLRDALALHERHDGRNRLTRGDLEAALARALEKQDRRTDAHELWDKAAADYTAVLKDPGAGKPEAAGAIAAFWRLERLFQRNNQYQRALRLSVRQGESWAAEALLGPRMKLEQGGLEVLLGGAAKARGLLRVAVAELERHDPVNLTELPPALNNLAVVELATEDPARAEQLGQKALTLYRRHRLPDDLVVVETLNLLGSCAAQHGDYAVAIEHFRDGVGRCEKLGAAADPPRCNLLLNVALLHKAQGDLAESLAVCKQAEAVFGRFAEPNALGFAAFAAAQANLYAALSRVAEADAHGARVLKVCRKHGVTGGPLVVTAKHCRALRLLGQRDLTAAAATFDEVRTLQEKEKLKLLVPRTLNYLGLTEECRGDPDKAESFYRQAKAQQRDNPRAFPITRFITLWRLANMVDRRGRGAEARALLNEAVAGVEEARLRTYGDAKQRAAFFAQAAPAFDQLVEWCVRDGDLPGALDAVARGRSRTLLDQLLLARVDPREGLTGERGKRLRRQEQELGRRMSRLRAKAQMLPVEAEGTEAAKRLLAEFDKAQEEYAAVWREVLNASPVYRNLEDRRAVQKALAALTSPGGDKKMVLVYHVGREHSHVLLLGGRDGGEVFPLVVAKAVADRVGPPKPRTTAEALAGQRGLRLSPAPKQPAAPAATASGTTVPLGHDALRSLVDHYLALIGDPRFRPTRGLRLTPRDPRKPVPDQRLETLAEAVLPAAVRQRIRKTGPECVVVVPDGPLHKLPLEALVLSGGAEPRYVLDELPPLVYAPSTAILALLADRVRPTPRALSLLTVGNPAYPKADKEESAAPAKGRGVVGLRGQLPRLPFTAEESRRIRALFDVGRVTALEGSAATEKAVAASLAGRNVVHLAAHGFADERFGNLFGALALTPPARPEGPDDDGFLTLHEICRLPLEECELAVLSACVTNVGPQQPLEAGVTLASGFLAAGARRVVASQWSVDDRSTAALMESFFSEITAAAKKGGRVSYAAALRDARRKVKARPGWATPFHWAAFVLVGPAN